MTRLLVIDDSTPQRRWLRGVLTPSGLFDEIVEVDDGLHGLRILLEKPVDLVLCRFELGGLDGMKLIPTLQEAPATAAVPVVFMTGQPDGERTARALESGASDVLSATVHPAELVARLRLHLRLKRLQDDLRIKNETLARLSTVDALTGLRSRRYIDDVLSIEFLRARRYRNPLTVVMGDLDHFKRVNDDHGHLAGDAALRGVASILLDVLRGTDVAGRYGGEEILVVLAHNEISGGRVFAERWRRAVEEARFADPEGRPFSVTISLGLASFDPEMSSPESLVGAADAALYRAKQAGRNRIALAGPGSDDGPLGA